MFSQILPPLKKKKDKNCDAQSDQITIFTPTHQIVFSHCIHFTSCLCIRQESKFMFTKLVHVIPTSMLLTQSIN